MPTLNEYFDQILLINLDHRPDKLGESLIECAKHGIAVRRIAGVWLGPGWGNDGCTQAHAKALETIVANGWQRTLILEDDFVCRFDDMQERFSRDIVWVLYSEAKDWEMLYLGGHYAEKPQARINSRVIRTGHMFTTSSYAVTLELAKEVAPVLRASTMTAIDNMYAPYNVRGRCYCLQPRLMMQRMSFSDIQQRVCNNGPCMEDPNHENMV